MISIKYGRRNHKITYKKLYSSYLSLIVTFTRMVKGNRLKLELIFVFLLKKAKEISDEMNQVPMMQ